MTPGADRLTWLLLAIIAIALVWLALRPHVLPARAEAAREAVTVNLERIGARMLWDGTIPVRCVK